MSRYLVTVLSDLLKVIPEDHELYQKTLSYQEEYRYTAPELISGDVWANYTNFLIAAFPDPLQIKVGTWQCDLMRIWATNKNWGE